MGRQEWKNILQEGRRYRWTGNVGARKRRKHRSVALNEKLKGKKDEEDNGDDGNIE